MSLEAECCYRRLLDYQWMMGTIPNPESDGNFRVLASLCKHVRASKMKKLWVEIRPCFEVIEDGSKVVNPQLERVRRDSIALRAKRKSAGKQGGRPKQNESTWLAKRKPPSPTPSPVSSATSPSETTQTPTADAVLASWNESRGSLPEVKKLTTERRQKIRSRLRDPEFPAKLVRAVKIAAESEFCVQGGWMSFDWMIKDETNIQKVLEGQYSNGTHGHSHGPECGYGDTCSL